MKQLLVDTSIWIEYFKGSSSAAGIIHDNDSHTVCITGPIITELIQGLKTKSEKEVFSDCLDSLPKIIITDQDWVDAGLLGNDLREIGITIPLSDLIIYIIARNNNCAVCTLDKHFEIINKNTAHNIEIIGLKKQ